MDKGGIAQPRSVQGRAVIVQAGSSDQGRDFAAQYADIVFTMQPSAEEAKAFYRDVKERAAKYGCKPDELKVFQGITPFAADKAEEIKNNLDALTGYALQRFKQIFKKLDIELDQLDQQLNLDQLKIMSEAEQSTTAHKLYQQASSGDSYGLC